MKTLTGQFFVLIAVCLLDIAHAGDSPSADSSRVLSSIPDKATALRRALDFTGFDLINDSAIIHADTKVVIVTAVDSTTPFLGDQINGRRVWEVTFDSIYLDLPGWDRSAVRGQVRKNFSVLIDSASGCLMKITGLSSDGHRSDIQPLSGTEATIGMRGTGEEVIGFPDSIPPTNLFEALSVSAASQPMSVPELHIWLFNWSDMGKPPIPVWMVIGMPVENTYHTMGPDVMVQRDRQRSIIDATDGKPRAFTNTP